MAHLVTWYATTFYQYKELCFESDSANPFTFRLLHLYPGINDEDLAGTLRECSLYHSTPSYICLSYRWEGKDSGRFISIGGRRIEIWENLWAFLRVLRSPTRVVTLWADAICIDQENRRERSHQVGLMGDIYRNARRVHAWLGAADEDSGRLFEWARQGRSRQESGPSPDFAQRALSNLTQRSYWSRAWIVQECIMARDIVIHCGNDTIGWDCLVDRCVSILNDLDTITLQHDSVKDQAVSRMSSGQRKGLEDGTSTAVVNLDNALEHLYYWRQLTEARNNLCPHKRHLQDLGIPTEHETQSRTEQSRMPFLQLLAGFSRSQCSVPLDKFYAFVPLSSLTCQYLYPPGSVCHVEDFRKPWHTPCQHGKMEDHQAVTPDYSTSFASAAIKLAFAQGPENIGEAWRLIGDNFGKELDSLRRATFVTIRVGCGPLTYEDLQVLYSVMNSGVGHFTDSAEFGPVREQFMKVYVPWLMSGADLKSAQGESITMEMIDRGRHFVLVSLDELDALRQDDRPSWDRPSHTLFRDGVLFSFGRQCCRELLGFDFLPRVKLLERSSHCIGSGVKRKLFLNTCLPFWRWRGQQRFELPMIDLEDEPFQPGQMCHQDFLNALWGRPGREPWPDEAWRLALSRGYKGLKYDTSVR